MLSANMETNFSHFKQNLGVGVMSHVCAYACILIRHVIVKTKKTSLSKLYIIQFYVLLKEMDLSHYES